MSWNYRTLKRIYDSGKIEYAIHEVYYDDDIPRVCSTDSISPYGETLEELTKNISFYLLALTKPVLDYDDFEYDESFLDID